MICRFAPGVVWLWLLSTSAFASDITVHGFVTVVNSPTSFQIDDYKVTRDKSVLLELEPQHGGISLATFRPEDIRTGTELEITGAYDENSGELKASSIKVFSYDTLTVKRTALLEKLPSLTKSDAGWNGVIYADGQKITVSPATAITLKPNQAERTNAAQHDAPEALTFVPDSLNLDTFVHYEGVRESDGSIKAQKAEFEHAEVDEREVRMWSRFAPKVILPDYANHQPGELETYRKEYKILPSQEAQQYISRLGNSVIPAHQKELSDNNPLKIPFQFFLVEQEGFNALTYPNGVVIVYSGVFDVLENEAQLAFALSHEISHLVERHAWQQDQHFRDELIALRARGVFVPDRILLANLRASGFSSQYVQTLENQADRVGLEWMLTAGYDVREAPQSWKAVARKMRDSTSNPFWSSRENYTARRSYLMSELRNNYSNADYSTLKKDSDQFHRVVDIVKGFGNGKIQKPAVAAKEAVTPPH